MMRGGEFFDAHPGAEDPALLREAGDRVATLLVRGARESDDSDVAERIAALGETEGLETLAEIWAGAPADSVAGCLWRLYLLRAWVHADARQVATEFEAGQHRAQVARVVSGVPDPPRPEELRRLIDGVLAGIARAEFADVLLQAAAFTRVLAVGRAALGEEADDPARLFTMAEQLEHAAHLELAGQLG